MIPLQYRKQLYIAYFKHTHVFFNGIVFRYVGWLFILQIY